MTQEAEYVIFTGACGNSFSSSPVRVEALVVRSSSHHQVTPILVFMWAQYGTATLTVVNHQRFYL